MNYSNLPIMLVDDEPRISLSYGVMLRGAGYEKVITVDDSRKVMNTLACSEVAVIVLDLFMPHLSGLELLPLINNDYPDIPVVVMTAASKIETAVECMKAGAFDYLLKPVDKNDFLSSIKKAVEVKSLRTEVSSLKHYLLTDKLEREDAFSDFVTGAASMRPIFQYIEAIAPSRQPVMITGETGVGKELVAKAVHDVSGCSGEFVAVNAAGLDDVVFSDTLFGHAKGAYTGAQNVREGLISKAAGGTLFLDEIGDLEASSQVKLLRLLQEQSYYPLGSDTQKFTDARIVVATNRTVQDLQQSDDFRSDLFFRLRTHHVHIPPLRERKEDIPLLLNAFLEEGAASMGKENIVPQSALCSLLSSYSFPGNVRELKSMVLDAVARHQSGKLGMESFNAIIADAELESLSPQNFSEARQSGLLSAAFGYFPTLKEVEGCLIEEAMKVADGNQGVAASYLGLSRQALNKRLIRSSKADK